MRLYKKFCYRLKRLTSFAVSLDTLVSPRYNQHLIFIFVNLQFGLIPFVGWFVCHLLFVALTHSHSQLKFSPKIEAVETVHWPYTYICTIWHYEMEVFATNERTLDKYKNYTKSSFYCIFGFSSVPLWKYNKPDCMPFWIVCVLFFHIVYLIHCVYFVHLPYCAILCSSHRHSCTHRMNGII